MALHDPLDTDLTGKTCTGCRTFKPWEDFHVRPERPGQRKSRCADCLKGKSTRYYRDRRAKSLVHGAKARAKKRGIEFALDGYEARIAEQLEIGCELTGIAFAQPESRRDWNSPSLDRIDGSKGYVVGNVRLILWSLNMALATWGEDQFEVVARAWMGRRNER